MADKIKFALALLFLVAGVVAFYLLSAQPVIVGILCVLAGVAAAAGVLWKTEPGARFIIFAQEAVAEAKKVVWPTRKETLQTTGVVFAFVLIMAIFLWVTDKSLEWFLYDVVLGWKKS